MNNFLSIFKKEVKELMTKEMILGLVFMVIMFGMLGNFIGGIKEETEKPINLAILDLDKSEYSKKLLDTLSNEKNTKVEIIQESNTKKAISETKEKGTSVFLVIPHGFEKNIKEIKRTEVEIYSIIKGFAMREATSSATLTAMINSINRGISMNFIQKAIPDKNPENIINPLNVKEFVVVKDKITLEIL